MQQRYVSRLLWIQFPLKIFNCEGQCIELGAGGYRCHCEGTNYYGENCQYGIFNCEKKCIQILFILECPEKLGENAFGLSESYLPLECQFN